MSVRGMLPGKGQKCAGPREGGEWECEGWVPEISRGEGKEGSWMMVLQSRS